MPPPPRNILKSKGSEMFWAFLPWHFSSEKSIFGQNRDEAIVSSCLMLVMALHHCSFSSHDGRSYSQGHLLQMFCFTSPNQPSL